MSKGLAKLNLMSRFELLKLIYGAELAEDNTVEIKEHFDQAVDLLTKSTSYQRLI